MLTQDFTQKTRELIDNLKNICAAYGLGNDGNEFKIITQVFLYKFLNDKFAFAAKKIRPELAHAEKWEQAISAMGADELEMLQLQMGAETALLKPEHFITHLWNRQYAPEFAKLFDNTLRDIAISKGLISSEAALSDSDIDNLLFLPGFSTATTVSALSGRGVGMDVVRSAIQSLGGRITITSEPGKGTKFSISLPLTLAVLDGMVVRVAGETLVVPLSSILETATLTRDDIRALGPHTNVIHVRGAFVPLFDLGAELGYRQAKANYAGSIVLLTSREDGSRSALVVDAIMEQRQVVIKGLQQSYGHIPGIAAATILGDGQIALILDPADLVEHATGRTNAPDFALAG